MYVWNNSFSQRQGKKASVKFKVVNSSRREARRENREGDHIGRNKLISFFKCLAQLVSLRVLIILLKINKYMDR